MFTPGEYGNNLATARPYLGSLISEIEQEPIGKDECFGKTCFSFFQPSVWWHNPCWAPEGRQRWTNTFPALRDFSEAVRHEKREFLCPVTSAAAEGAEHSGSMEMEVAVWARGLPVATEKGHVSGLWGGVQERPGTGTVCRAAYPFIL